MAYPRHPRANEPADGRSRLTRAAVLANKEASDPRPALRSEIPLHSVEIERVTKRFGRVVAVDDLSLSVPQGCVYGFIGPNGSGKTTTLRMIMNIFYPDSGRIRVFGEPLHGACTDRIGYLPEERGLYRDMKVRDLLRFYGELKEGRDVPRHVDHWLARFDLERWAQAKVGALSKGMSQKVQFIAAVVAQPQLLILDEPFTGLDPVNAEGIKAAILELQQQGTTVIFSTHDMHVAEKMCDRIFMIFKGRKVLDDSLAAIQERYGSDTIRLQADDGAAVLQELSGVERVTNHGRVQELRLKQGQDPQEILSAVMARTRLQSFEVTKPSLLDIFIRIAGPEAREAENAQDAASGAA